MPCCNFSATKAETKVSAYVADAVEVLLSGSGTGEVLMVNSSGIYLDVIGETVFLCDSVWGRVPLGIAMDRFGEITASLQLRAGQRVSFRESVISFEGGSLCIVAKDAQNEANIIEKPKAHMIRRAAEEIVAMRKTGGLSMLALPLVLNGEDTEPVSLNPYSVRAYPLLRELVQTLSSDGEAVQSCISGLLGLGTGLTPSADDVILGMLYAFRMLGKDAPQTVRRFRKSVAELANASTNRVSAAYLHAILSGAYFERMERVWRGLCGVEALDISVLTQIGSNSGSEMLLGILLALSVCGFATDKT